MVVMLQKKLSLLLHLQHKSLHLSIFSIPFVLNYGLLPGVSLTLSSLSWFPGRYDLKVGQFSTDIQSAIRYTWRDHWCRWTTWGMYMYIACAKALHCRSRVSFRVTSRLLLLRDFSRLPQMESFLAGYYVPLVNKSIPSVFWDLFHIS